MHIQRFDRVNAQRDMIDGAFKISIGATDLFETISVDILENLLKDAMIISYLFFCERIQ